MQLQMLTADATKMASAVAADRYNPLTRSVYADSLEEAGETEAARQQREIAAALSRGRTHDALPSFLLSQIKKKFHYRKRKVRIVLADQVTLHDTQWSGGTRSNYCVYWLNNQAVTDINVLAGLFPPGPDSVPIPEDACIVQTGYFCGRVATMYVHVRPEDYHLLCY